MKLRRDTLRQKIGALAQMNRFEPELLGRFEHILSEADAWGLRRINPLQFARAHALDARTTVDLFVHAAKVGLFDFEWSTLCPMCGSAEYHHNAIHQLDPEAFHCTVCDMDVSTELDGQVEVTFTINPAVATLELDPYADVESYKRYFRSPNYVASQALERALLEDAIQAFVVVPPDKTARLRFQGQPNTSCRVLSLDKHIALHVHVNGKRSALPQALEVDILQNGFAPARLDVPAGEITLHLHNWQLTRIGLLLVRMDMEAIERLMAEQPPQLAPFFSGQQLLNTQSFRELFRIQELPDDLRLKVGNLTVLFTDLKDSTLLYSRTGDVSAYRLVQRHFDALTAVTRAHAGAIVKTLGDAVMATFSTPQDGVAAALAMIEAVEALNTEIPDAENWLHLKAGLHTGPALVVKANEILDYFGQTVNIAARAQSLAEVREIWLTEDVYQQEEARALLEQGGYRAQKQSALLRGVSERVMLYKCARA